MGFKEWATKSNAERAQDRADLKVKWAANNAKFAQNNEDLKAGLAATKAEAAARKVERTEKYDAVRAGVAAKNAQRAGVREDREAGLAAKKAAQPQKFEGVTLAAGQVRYKGQGGTVAGATARVESAADVRRRVTAARVLAIGVFALAAKKQAGHVYLTVEHPDYEFVVEVPVKMEATAREFAAKVNNASKRAA